MTDVHDWDVSAGGNNQSPPDGFPEGMAPGAVNDAAREVMAAVARWFGDVRGILTTGGTGNAYTLTTNRGFTAGTLASVEPLFIVRVDRAPTGSATLNVDATGAKPWRIAGGVDLASGDLQPNSLAVVAYNSTTDQFESVIVSPVALDATSDRVLYGRALGAGAGRASFLDATAVRNIVGEFSDTARGIVPASGTLGSHNILRSDGWATITGFVQPYVGTTAPSGWLLLNGDTMGSTASGATQASDANEALFKLLWDSTTNNEVPVVGGRGASAQADWDADKQMFLPDARGRAVIGAGQGSGLTNRLNAQQVGAESQTTGLPSATINKTGDADSVATGNHTHSVPVMQPSLALNWIVKV